MIVSSQNSKIKEIRKLLTSRKVREAQGLLVVESPKVISALPPESVVYVLVEEGREWDGAITSSVHEVTAKLWKALTDTPSSQGVLAVVKKPKADVADLSGGLVVVLDNIQDPGNAGTLIRTAAAFGCSAVLISKGTGDPFSPKVVRASAGAVLQIPIVGLDISMLKEQGFTIMVTDTKHGRDFHHCPLNDKLALVFSNEGAGVSREWCVAADQRIHIPHHKRVESLNVAVSAGIVLEKLYSQMN